MRVFKMILMGLILTLGLTACGTVDGIGKDISSSARKVQGWL